MINDLHCNIFMVYTNIKNSLIIIIIILIKIIIIIIIIISKNIKLV